MFHAFLLHLSAENGTFYGVARYGQSTRAVLQLGAFKKHHFKIESDVSAVLVRNRWPKVVNQCFSVEMLRCAGLGLWGGFNFFCLLFF